MLFLKISPERQLERMKNFTNEIDLGEIGEGWIISIP